jgi:hypothetical protein
MPWFFCVLLNAINHKWVLFFVMCMKHGRESSFVSKASIKYALHFIVYVSVVWLKKYVNHYSLLNPQSLYLSLINVFMVMCVAWRRFKFAFSRFSLVTFFTTIVGANSSRQLPHNKSLWWCDDWKGFYSVLNCEGTFMSY